jgi:hypothetical protein
MRHSPVPTFQMQMLLSEPKIYIYNINENWVHGVSVADAHPDPLVRGTNPEPFYHQAKIVRKTWIPRVRYCFVTVTSLLPFIFENDVNVAIKSNKQKKPVNFTCRLEEVTDENSSIRIQIRIR